MDTLRLMMLSLLIGATVSTGPMYTNESVETPKAAVVQKADSGIIAAQNPVVNPTPQIQIVYVTPAPQVASQPATVASKPATATAASGRRELGRGAIGDDVRAAQRLLANLGYKIAVDGIFGTQMRNVVIQFQRNNGLKADGIIGARTYRKLTSSTARGPSWDPQPRTSLSYGMTGQDVSELQMRLKNLGYYYDLVSGNYLTNTRSAVTWFQAVNGLPQDGVAGPATQSRIYSSSAIPAPLGPMPGPTYYPWPTMPGPIPTPQPIVNRTLREGMSGTDVGYLQQRLRDLGYLNIQPTNYFGSQTYWAVRNFQSYNGLFVDGVVGASTRSRLFGGGAIPYPGPHPTATGIPWPPYPTATPTAGPYQNRCTFCGGYYTAAQAYLHAPEACGRHCASQTQYNHSSTTATCGQSGHYQCDGKNHTGAACNFGGHVNCDNMNHGTLPCGHRACDTSLDPGPESSVHKQRCRYCIAWGCYAIYHPVCPNSSNSVHDLVYP